VAAPAQVWFNGMDWRCGVRVQPAVDGCRALRCPKQRCRLPLASSASNQVCVCVCCVQKRHSRGWRPHGLSLCAHIDLFSRVRATIREERLAAAAILRGPSLNTDLMGEAAAEAAHKRRVRFLAALAQRQALQAEKQAAEPTTE